VGLEGVEGRGIFSAQTLLSNEERNQSHNPPLSLPERELLYQEMILQGMSGAGNAAAEIGREGGEGLSRGGQEAGGEVAGANGWHARAPTSRGNQVAGREGGREGGRLLVSQIWLCAF
jgi:hypothetical protein